MVVILHSLFYGMNKRCLREIEVRVKEVVELYLGEDDDKFLYDSLDRYLRMAIEVEVRREVEQEDTI